MTLQKSIIRRCFHSAFIFVSHVLMELKDLPWSINEWRRWNFVIFKLFQKKFCGWIEKPEPAFNVSFWSYYDRVISSIQRTINTLERWHRMLNSLFYWAPPNLAAGVKVLRREKQRMYFNLTQIKNGLFWSNWNWFIKEYHLRILCENFKNFDVESFFKLIDKLMTSKTE